MQTGAANNWIQVAAGTAHTVGLQANGTLWAWGNNSQGQLGTDTSVIKTRPYQIASGQSWKAIAAGDQHTLALRSDGTIWAWGNNSQGQLGDGSGATTNYPVQVGTDSDWKRIYAHGNISYGIKNNNTLYAWGANDRGQLGDTTSIDKLSPVLVGTNTNSFVIAATASNGGNISPSGAITATAGTSKTFSIAPLVGWHISDVKVDGISQGAITSYTFNSIVDRHSITVLFAPNNTVSHIITASAGIGASISPNGTVVVADGTSQLFSISAQSGYQITNVLVDSVSQGPQTTYIFNNVTANHTIQVTASLIDHTIPTGSITINGGAAATNNNVVSLTLSATDAGGNLYQMRFSLDNINWSAWEAYATSKNYTMPTGDGTKNIYVQYKDIVGNMSSAYHTSIILDTLAPSGSVSLVNGSATTTSLTMTAGISQTDSGSGVTQMQLSWDNVTWQAWETFSTLTSVTAPPGGGLKTLYVRLKDLAGNISQAINDSIFYVSPTATLSINVTGNGQVTDSANLHCQSSNCQVDYTTDTPLTLQAIPNADSTFTGWSGACSGTGTCGLTMNTDKSINATFLLAPNVLVGSKGFSTVQSAYEDPVTLSSMVIKLMEGNLSGQLTADRNILITLSGGYNAAYNALSSTTSIDGPLTIKSGTVTIENILVK